MESINTAFAAFWVLVCVQSPLMLIFIGGVMGVLTLYATAKAWELYRLLGTQHDRDAALLREVMAAADRLQVSDRA